MNTFLELKTRQRKEREEYPEGFGIRIHRALSWLERAEQCKDDDGRFIFLWIAFNSAYAQVLHEYEHTPETEKLYSFLKKLVALDRENKLYDLLWHEFSNSVRMLLHNQYVFPAFWAYVRSEINEEAFEERFNRSTRQAERALATSDTVTVLKVVLARLYTLRNQLMHGGATFNGKINRSQIRDASAFMSKLIPAILSLMMDNPDTIWGEAIYPVIKGSK